MKINPENLSSEKILENFKFAPGYTNTMFWLSLESLKEMEKLAIGNTPFKHVNLYQLLAFHVLELLGKCLLVESKNINANSLKKDYGHDLEKIYSKHGLGEEILKKNLLNNVIKMNPQDNALKYSQYEFMLCDGDIFFITDYFSLKYGEYGDNQNHMTFSNDKLILKFCKNVLITFLEEFNTTRRAS